MIIHRLLGELNFFCLSAKGLSYLLHIDPNGKPVLDYFGDELEEDEDYLSLKLTLGPAKGRGAILDEKNHPGLSLNDICSEFSTPFRGDVHNVSLDITKEEQAVFDFRYVDHSIGKAKPLTGLPTPRGGEELVLHFRDEALKVNLRLHYRIYEEGVIGRHVEIQNDADAPLILNKAMSYQLCLENRGYVLESFYGNWAGEFQKEETEIKHMGYFFGSDTGSSGDQNNPFFMLKEKDAGTSRGNVYGFQLLYSGSHREEIQEDSYGRIRVMAGISPLGFSWSLGKGETFVTPMGLLTYSSKGVNGISEAFASFSIGRVLPSVHAKDLRPIIYNNWEGTYFDFDEKKILRLAKKAKKLGVELFVLDDGWFGKRDSDFVSLGDYAIHKKKLPHGLSYLSKKVHGHGMQFGLWVEPEAVSPDSDLYRAHPDWAIHSSYHEPCLGRHQLILDLTKKEVRDYIYDSLCKTFDEAKVDFIKWDYNRIMTDLPDKNAYMHRYILGLYELLFRLRERYPSLWMENCASGGGRNDLGMMSFFDTCWVSDNTDSFERVAMQTNMGKGYPLCCMSNHVSGKTSHQMLRKTSLDTKFDIASFGVLGYELNLNELDPLDEKDIIRQIAYYKEIRPTMQYGRFAILEEKGRAYTLMCQSQEASVVLKTNVATSTHPSVESLLVEGLNPKTKYAYEVRPESISFLKFGSLINYVSPIRLKEEGKIVHFLSRRKALPNENFSGTAYGSTLMQNGVKLSPEWNAIGIENVVRVMGDFGARLYRIRPFCSDLDEVEEEKSAS